jgi:hypothetical protein
MTPALVLSHACDTHGREAEGGVWSVLIVCCDRPLRRQEVSSDRARGDSSDPRSSGQPVIRSFNAFRTAESSFPSRSTGTAEIRLRWPGARHRADDRERRRVGWPMFWGHLRALAVLLNFSSSM